VIDNPSDDLAVTARLHGIRMFFTTDENNDNSDPE